MARLPILFIPPTNKPLVVGYTTLITFYIVAFSFSLILSTYINNIYPLLFWLFMVFGSISWIIISATVCFLNISRTTEVLKSIDNLVNDPSSYFWIALQSNFFQEISFGKQISKSDVQKSRETLSFDKLFYCPVLSNNLRNSKPVTGFSLGYTWDGTETAACVEAASIPKAPPALSSTSMEKSLYLPLSSIFKLKEAVKHAYNHEVMGKPKVLVVILDDRKMLKDVEEGLAGLNIVRYYEPEDRDNCEAF